MANNNSNTTYTLRLQSDNVQHDLSNSIKHWGKSRMYDDKQIDAIESSNKKSYHQPTSVPSPFARIALVKTAFGEVAEHGDKALTAYQKIVSDCLDIAEIFFTFDKWKNDIEIITWKYGRKENSCDLEDDSDLKKLETGHRQLYKTLKTFLESDAEEFNFDKLKCIYILKHKKSGEMIGATSPCTLFFSSANDYSNINIQLSSNRKAFEGIKPLYERNWDFQKYIYSWIAVYNEPRPSNGGKSIFYFHEFHKYLEKQKPIIDRTDEIDKLNKINQDEYNILRSPDVEVLGKPLHQIKEISADSLTVNDVFEDKIIRLPYPIQKESFFDGNLPNDQMISFLLPIKDNFFHYYSIDDLRDSIRINIEGNAVKVVLSINSNNYEKNYTNTESIVDAFFDCALFPNVKFESDEIAFYRFGLVCNFIDKEKFKADFIKINASINSDKKRYSTRNETYTHNDQLKNYSLERSNFDYIKINYNGINGIVIPNKGKKSGNNEYTFSVDLGTTNTHIEYRINDGKDIKTFDITNEKIDEKQLCWLHGGDEMLKDVFDAEFIPQYTNEEFKFPMRTALSYGENINWIDVYPFEKASLNGLYEKRLDFPYNRTETDLKWSGKEYKDEKVEVYIKSLFYILRNKVVIGGGDLKKTKIIWFYPVSMERARYDNLVKAWEKSYSEYFNGSKSNIKSLTESVAPFEYYVRDRDAKNLITVDIGGGTTDAVISVNGRVDYITSFRFAANSVFGDGYSESNRVKNGIIRQFFDKIKEDLQSKINENDPIFNLFDYMEKNQSSDNIASFLFSIGQNKTVLTAGKNLAYNANLSKKLVDDSSQKITFIFFYTAIIYHLAKLVKSKELQMPDKLVFSGNGSRVIQYFTDDPHILKSFTKLIFEKINNEKYHENDLEIIINEENPKEATCKGGLFVEHPEPYNEILRKKVVLHSNGTDQVINLVNKTNEEISESDKYRAINDDYLRLTVEEAKKFIQFVFDLLPFFSNEGYKLNTTYINLAKRVCFNRLDIYAQNGWELKKKEIDLNEVIDETLFFYPLTGMMSGLAGAIADYIKDGANPIGFKEDELF